MISTFFSMNTIPKESQMQYVFLINMLYPATLSAAAVLIGYPLWASRWKETNVMAICWNIIIFFHFLYHAIYTCIFMTRKFRDSLTSICLKRLVVYKFSPSIRTHIGLALFIMINKQVIVAPFIVLLQNNKKSTTPAPPLQMNCMKQ